MGACTAYAQQHPDLFGDVLKSSYCDEALAQNPQGSIYKGDCAGVYKSVDGCFVTKIKRSWVEGSKTIDEGWSDRAWEEDDYWSEHLSDSPHFAKLVGKHHAIAPPYEACWVLVWENAGTKADMAQGQWDKEWSWYASQLRTIRSTIERNRIIPRDIQISQVTLRDSHMTVIDYELWYGFFDDPVKDKARCAKAPESCPYEEAVKAQQHMMLVFEKDVQREWLASTRNPHKTGVASPEYGGAGPPTPGPAAPNVTPLGEQPARLKKELAAAVAAEDYDLAAELKDQLLALAAQPKDTSAAEHARLTSEVEAAVAAEEYDRAAELGDKLQALGMRMRMRLRL
jgi:hypothetical protein